MEEHPDIYKDVQTQVRQSFGIDADSIADREDPEKVKEKREETENNADKKDKK